jgi:hypothetical protein
MSTDRHRLQHLFRASSLAIIGAALIACMVTLGTSGTNASSIALITKIVQDVTRKPVSIDEWQKAAKGEMLISGDRVRTGARSIAIIKFIDNSIVRVRERSELSIDAEPGRGAMMKNVRLQLGTVGFEVNKQPEDHFRLTSPASVASIRGTTGRLSAGPSGDTLTVTEGLVAFRNSASGTEVSVAGGFIGISNPDGTIETREASPDELKNAMSAATGGLLNELNLQFRNDQGSSKQLKLKFRQ